MRSTVTIFLCLIAGWLAAEEPTLPALPPPEPIKTGVIHSLTCSANADARYKLRLPAAYDKEPTRLFPVVINQNPSGRTNLKPYEAWAEQQGVILLGIDGISNGKDQGFKNRIADSVLKDIVARGVRAHPTLRVAIGMSGGSADGMRLVRRKPEAYAGCVYMGAGTIIENPKAKHLAYAILGGAKDEWMAGDQCESMAAKARELGCAVRLEVEIDRQHKEAPLERQTAALTWIIELQKLQLPSLSAEERAANITAARERMKSVATIADASARRAEAQLLLSLTPLKAFADERGPVVVAWASAMKELAAAEKSAVTRNAFISMEVLGDAYAADLPPETKAAFEQHVTDLRKDPAVAKDWLVRRAYAATEAIECRAGLKPELLGAVLPLWEALARDAAGTEWEAKVARRIRIVKLFIESPSTLQKPTKLKE